MLKIEYTGKFRRDFKIIKKQNKNMRKFEEVVAYLQTGRPLPEKYCDHSLITSKYYKNKRECHIEPDWLLVYEIYQDRLVLELFRTGSHSELFR